MLVATLGMTIVYEATKECTVVEFEKGKDNCYKLLWSSLDVILPIGDDRNVLMGVGWRSLNKVVGNGARAIFKLPFSL